MPVEQMCHLYPTWILLCADDAAADDAAADASDTDDDGLHEQISS